MHIHIGFTIHIQLYIIHFLLIPQIAILTPDIVAAPIISTPLQSIHLAKDI